MVGIAASVPCSWQPPADAGPTWCFAAHAQSHSSEATEGPLNVTVSNRTRQRTAIIVSQDSAGHRSSWPADSTIDHFLQAHPEPQRQSLHWQWGPHSQRVEFSDIGHSFETGRPHVGLQSDNAGPVGPLHSPAASILAGALPCVLLRISSKLRRHLRLS